MNNKNGLIITASNKITSSMSKEEREQLEIEIARRAKNREHISGLFGRHRITVHTLVDTTLDNLKNTINDIFKYHDENDISYIYINCHGNVNGLALVSDGDKTVSVPYTEIRSIFNVIKGTVVLMIEACNSGESITAKQANLRSLNKVDLSLPQEKPQDMNKAIISAFSAPKRDPRLRSGELRSDKYQVITSCHGDETAWGNKEGNHFTNFWCNGAGWDYKNNSETQLMADTSNKGYVTLQDLCNYSQQQSFYDDDEDVQRTVYQNDMCYPENSDFPAFGTEPISFISAAIDYYYRTHKDIFKNPIGPIVRLSSGTAYQNYSGGVIVRYASGPVVGHNRLSYILNRIRQTGKISDGVRDDSLELYIVVSMYQDSRCIVNKQRWPDYDTHKHGGKEFNIIYEGKTVDAAHPKNTNVFYNSDVLHGESRIYLTVEVWDYDSSNGNDHIMTYYFNLGIENGWGIDYPINLPYRSYVAGISLIKYLDVIPGDNRVKLDLTIRKL